MSAQANCLSLIWTLSLAMAFSMVVNASVATWCPSPLLPEWIMMQTCPTCNIDESSDELNIVCTPKLLWLERILCSWDAHETLWWLSIDWKVEWAQWLQQNLSMTICAGLRIVRCTQSRCLPCRFPFFWQLPYQRFHLLPEFQHSCTHDTSSIWQQNVKIQAQTHRTASKLLLPPLENDHTLAMQHWSQRLPRPKRQSLFNKSASIEAGLQTLLKKLFAQCKTGRNSLSRI